MPLDPAFQPPRDVVADWNPQAQRFDTGQIASSSTPPLLTPRYSGQRGM